MIKVTGLYKKYNKKEIFINASFVLPDSGLYVLFGDNGIGKTTLAKILMGETAFEGKIEIDKIKYNKKSRRKLIEQIFYIGQRHNYVTFLNGDENASLSKSLWKSKNQIKQTSTFTRPMTELSEGEQIIMVLESVYNSPKNIIILDEVTAFLDDEYFAYSMEHIEELAKGKLVIFITHDDRVEINNLNKIIIKNKQIITEGPLVCNNEKINHRYIRNKEFIFKIFFKKRKKI